MRSSPSPLRKILFEESARIRVDNSMYFEADVLVHNIVSPGLVRGDAVFSFSGVDWTGLDIGSSGCRKNRSEWFS